MNLSTFMRAPGLRVATLAVSAAAVLGSTTNAFAGNSNRAELRGYNNCVAASTTNQLSGVTLPRVYYIAKQADSRVYYVNVSGWDKGVRVARRITCETSRLGHKVRSVTTADGRYARGAGPQTIVAIR